MVASIVRCRKRRLSSEILQTGPASPLPVNLPMASTAKTPRVEVIPFKEGDT
jgi:hypothetical protein